jgi:acyl dehydratase
MTDVTLPAIASAQSFRDRVGGEPFESGSIEVGQQQVDQFADATGDHQWIHVDPERARRESPFGGPVAHGFLTLSLIPALMADAIGFDQKMGVNYGLNRVRFVKPVPVGSRVRGVFSVKDVVDAPRDGVQVTWSVSLQIEQAGEPAVVCVAEFVTLHYF